MAKVKTITSAPTKSENNVEQMPQPPIKPRTGQQTESNLVEVGHTVINKKAMEKENRVSPGYSLYLFLQQHAMVASELINWLGTDYMAKLVAWHIASGTSTADGERATSEFDSIIMNMEQNVVRDDEGQLRPQNSYKVSMVKRTG